MSEKEIKIVEDAGNIVPITQSAQVLLSLTNQISSGSLQPEQLGMILDAQERVLDREAKQQFSIAMAACQSQMPAILKTAENTQTHSKYETLDALNKAVSPVYTSNGFSVSFGTDTAHSIDDPMLRVTAEVSHVGGWVKNYHYDLPYDDLGIKGNVNKTKIHASGSTLSYGRRYLLKLIFNLTTVDELDDDGNESGAGEFEAMSYELERMKIVSKAIIEYCGAISVIKQGIEAEMLADASQAWHDLSDDEKKSLWIAPSKGGAFTTLERKEMGTEKFRIARMNTEELAEYQKDKDNFNEKYKDRKK